MLYVNVEENYKESVVLQFRTKCYSDVVPIDSIQDFISVIESLFGKGSNHIYNEEGKVVGFEKGKLSKIQSALKIQVIDQCRKQLRVIWGNIPELQAGWLEARMRNYQLGTNRKRAILNHVNGINKGVRCT